MAFTMRFSISPNWIRVMGISTLFLLGYIVLIGIFGNVDVTPLLPEKLAASIVDAWPKLPFFQQASTTDGDNERIIYYTVPTRIFTPQELAAMRKAEAAQKKIASAKEAASTASATSSSAQ